MKPLFSQLHTHARWHDLPLFEADQVTGKPNQTLNSGLLNFVCKIPKLFSKVLYRVILCSKYARALTF